MKNNEKSLFELGLEAINEADFHSAIESFEQCISHETTNSQAWFYLGLSYLESGYIHRAIEAFAKTIELDPQHADAHYLLGNAMGASGEIDRAVACYQATLAINPRHLKAEEFLIRTMALIESRTHYRHALKIIHGGPRKNGWVSEALRELVQSVAIFTASPARNDLATCVAEILTSVQEASRPIPIGDADPIWARHCTEGYYALRRANWAAAAAAYQKAVEYRDTDPVTHNALGVAYFQSGDTDRAVQAWLRVMDLDPEFDFMQLLSS